MHNRPLVPSQLKTHPSKRRESTHRIIELDEEVATLANQMDEILLDNRTKAQACDIDVEQLNSFTEDKRLSDTKMVEESSQRIADHKEEVLTDANQDEDLLSHYNAKEPSYNI